MFRLQFFGSLSRQRKELLAAHSFAPLPLHPSVERQLQLSMTAVDEPPLRLQRPSALLWHPLRDNLRLILGYVGWSILHACVVLGTVIVARYVVQTTNGLAVGVALAGAYLLLKIVQASIQYYLETIRRQVHRALQVSLFRCINTKLIHIAPSGRAQLSAGQLKTLIGTDVGAIEDFLSAALQQWTPIVVSSVILIPALYVVSGVVGLVALAVVLLLLPIAVGGAACVEYFQKRALAEQDILTTTVGEWVKNIRLVRYLGWGQALESEINGTMRRFVLLSSIRHAVVVAVWAVTLSWSMLPLLAILVVSSWFERPLNLVEVFSSFWLLDHIINQVQHIPVSLTMYGSASAGTKRVDELLKQPDLSDWIEPAPATEVVTSQEPERLVLSNVSVVYDSHIALDNVSLELSLNEQTAIVGSVGSGKTTLLEVLVGELPVTSGRVSVTFSDNRVVPLWREDVYRRMRALMAYSPQQPFLSNATLRCNIDLSGARTTEEVDFAVVAAQLHEDLAFFPHGLEEEIGESGINLSGGQKQRVSLARAFISKRPFLILDDPLSAVDPRTEGLLMNAIVEAGKGVILVSHRLEQLERCDRVIVLDRGRVVEDGSPQALAQNRGSRFSQFLRAVEEHGH